MNAPHERTDGERRVPRAAAFYGGLGAVPFVVLAVAAAEPGGAWRSQALFALGGYGAVIANASQQGAERHAFEACNP